MPVAGGWTSLKKIPLFPPCVYHCSSESWLSLVDPKPQKSKVPEEHPRQASSNTLCKSFRSNFWDSSDEGWLCKDMAFVEGARIQTNERDLCFWTWDVNSRPWRYWWWTTKPTQETSLRSKIQKLRLKESHQESASWSTHEVLLPNFLDT